MDHPHICELRKLATSRDTDPGLRAQLVTMLNAYERRGQWVVEARRERDGHAETIVRLRGDLAHALDDLSTTAAHRDRARAELEEARRAAQRLPAARPLEWKSSSTSEHAYPDLPIEHRLYLAAHDADAAHAVDPDSLHGWGEGDGDYDEIRGLLAEREWHRHIEIANVMGLVGDWDVDDVEAAVADALHEYRGLRAALEESRAEALRLLGRLERYDGQSWDDLVPPAPDVAAGDAATPTTED